MASVLRVFLWTFAGVVVAGALLLQLRTFIPRETEDRPLPFTNEDAALVQEIHRGGQFRGVGDYYVCEPKAVGYDVSGRVLADYVNPVWVIYRSNHDKFITDRLCW